MWLLTTRRSPRYLRAGEPRFPAELTAGLQRQAVLRYGENPHLQAAVYRSDAPGPPTGLLGAEQLHGMEMSYLNYFDTDAAWRAAIEFDHPSVVIVKHATPCGIASNADIAVAYQRAYEGDEISPFGGIIAANREVTWDMTEAMKGKRYDIIVAPGYEEAALERLRKRRDLRILRIAEKGKTEGRRGWSSGPSSEACSCRRRTISAPPTSRYALGRSGLPLRVS